MFQEENKGPYNDDQIVKNNIEFYFKSDNNQEISSSQHSSLQLKRQSNQRRGSKQIQSQPSKLQIYNDTEFKEVTKNFYILIVEINKLCKGNKKESKRISKRQSFRRISEDVEDFKTFQKFKKPKEEPLKKELDKRSDLYRFKNDHLMNFKEKVDVSFNNNQFSSKQLIQQFGDLIKKGSEQRISSQAPPKIQPPNPQELIQNNHHKFKRNAYHSAIAYHIYMSNQSKLTTEINIQDKFDPTFRARNLQKNNSKSSPIKEKQSIVSKEESSRKNNNQTFLVKTDEIFQMEQDQINSQQQEGYGELIMELESKDESSKLDNGDQVTIKQFNDLKDIKKQTNFQEIKENEGFKSYKAVYEELKQ